MTVHKKMDEAGILNFFRLAMRVMVQNVCSDYIPLILDLIQGGKVFIVDEMERLTSITY